LASLLLVDGDPLGGGIDVGLGCEALPGVRWGDLAEGEGRLSAATLDAALPHPHGIALLSHGRQGPTAPRSEVMTTVLDAGVRGYDLVLIDCPPSLGALTRQALAASDSALIVTTPSYFGLQGVERALAEVEEIRKTVNPQLSSAGILVNRVRSNAEEHAYRVDELGEIHGRRSVLQPLIPDRIAVQQAESMGVPVQMVRSEGGREVARAFDTHLNRLLRATRPS